MLQQSESSFQLVSPTSIENDKRWNLHPWIEGIPSSLEESFFRSGILNPPMLIAGKNGLFTILTGHRRVLFWKQQYQEKELLCRCFSHFLSAEKCLAIILDDQRFSGRELTLAEKARFIQLAKRNLCIEKKELMELLPLLGMKKNPELLKNLDKLAEESAEILTAAHNGQLSLQIYTELQKLQAKDRPTLLELFATLQLGSSKQRRFLLELRDCAYARGQGIAELLQQQELQQIITSTQLNIPQKIHHLGTTIQKLLQPSLYKEEEVFKQEMRQLSLPENYTVKHSPAFEKDEITLEILFNNFDECKRYLQKEEC